MNFDLTEDQQVLQRTAAAFAKRESPPARLRKLREDPLGYSRDLWRQMGELGWLGLALPEEAGGYGGSFVDVALLLEQLGATLTPEPYLASVVLGGMPLLEGDAAQRERWLAPMIEGQATLALAWAERDGRFDPLHVTTRAERAGDGWELRGRKQFVLNGHAADALVVSARGAGGAAHRDGISLFVVDRGAPGLKVQPIRTMDGGRAAMVELDGVRVERDALLGEEGGAAAALERALDLGATAACAEALGVMRAVLDMTCEYLRTREQFGVKIGSFQVLQHRAVDMFIETELARSMTILASVRATDPDPVERQAAVSAAKAQIAAGGRLVTQQAIQLHGGIGITDEHDVGLYFKRMHALGTICGDEEHHVARYAGLSSFTAGV